MMGAENKKPYQGGCDGGGSIYKDIQEMWDVELKGKPSSKAKNMIGTENDWYQKQGEYWDKTEATINGVLGGYPELDDPDIKHSKVFLSLSMAQQKTNKGRAIDCGAGIGRITKSLLNPVFEKIDVVDQCANYIEKSKTFLVDCKIGHFIHSGLQELKFIEKYDVIWIQWVSNYLTDEHFVEFLSKCRENLNPNGIVVVKENHTREGFLLDKEDFSVTRSSQMYIEIFEKAGFKVFQQSKQPNFPKDMLQVIAYALIPV